MADELEDGEMATPVRPTREKISTTISSATLAYLELLIEHGEARSLADAIDVAVRKLLVFENRERLANDTAAYFDGMSPEEAEEEARLGAALAGSVKGIDFDREP
jgi:Arc/MetJ-type ribon-helix-helix transcriptional regulator